MERETERENKIDREVRFERDREEGERESERGETK